VGTACRERTGNPPKAGPAEKLEQVLESGLVHRLAARERP
jgi:hypothetical protein